MADFYLDSPLRTGYPKSLARHAITLAGIGVLSACATPALEPVATVRGIPGMEVSKQQLVRNRAIFRREFPESSPEGRKSAGTEESAKDPLDSFKEEQRWYQPAPQLCLALSGGGMRSGTYGTGILYGLAKIGLLDKVMILSGVSGGSYAATGFYSQYYHRNLAKTDHVEAKTLIGDSYIGALMSRGRIFHEAEWPGHLWKTLGNAPANLLENGLFGRHTNTSVIADEYRRRLMWAYQFAPKEASGKAAWNDKGERNFPTEISLREFDLKTSVKAGLPFLIVNATSQYNKASTSPLPLAKRVFEFTPLAYGSDALGRHSLTEGSSNPTLKEVGLDELHEFSFRDFPYLSLIGAISGAAVDWTDLVGDLPRIPLSALNTDLGWHIRNPRIPDQEEKIRNYKNKVFPLYFFDPLFYNDVNGLAWYVTDGGHTENIGLFSLIRRGCGNIVVADGEGDPNFVFESYFKLKRELLAEDSLNVVMSIPTIDDIEKRHQGAKKAKDKDDLAKELAKQFGHYPLRFGSVGLFPVPKDDKELTGFRKYRNIEWRDIQLAYIKLAHPTVDSDTCKSILAVREEIAKTIAKEKPQFAGNIAKAIEYDPQLLLGHQPPTDLVAYYYCANREYNRVLPRKLIAPNDFPHQGVADLNYSPLQVLAYVCLGFRSVLDNKERLLDMLRNRPENIDRYLENLDKKIKNAKFYEPDTNKDRECPGLNNFDKNDAPTDIKELLGSHQNATSSAGGQ